MVEELTQEDFDEKTKQGKVVLDFYADWCGPCQIVKPVFEKVSKELNECIFFRVDVEKNREQANAYAVRSIPTIIFLKDGKEVSRYLGALPEDALKEKIKQSFN